MLWALFKRTLTVDIFLVGVATAGSSVYSQQLRGARSSKSRRFFLDLTSHLVMHVVHTRTLLELG